MRVISKKLKSEDGATLFFALLFFVLCAVAGSIVLSSATGVTGQLTSLNRNDTDYYVVSSAARYLSDVITESEFSITDIKEEKHTRTEFGTETETTYTDGNLFQIKDDTQYSDTFMVSKLRACFHDFLDETEGKVAAERWESGVSFKYSGKAVTDDTDYVLDVEGLSEKETLVTFNIDDAGNISMTVKPEDGSYMLKLTAVAEISLNETTDYVDNPDSSRSFITTRTTTIKYPASGITVQKVNAG